MVRQPPRSKRNDTLFPYTTLFRSECREPGEVGEEDRDLASLAVGRRGTLAGGLGTDRGRLVEAGDRGQPSLAVAERGDAEVAQVLVRQVAKQVRPATVLCKGGRVFLEAERFYPPGNAHRRGQGAGSGKRRVGQELY